MKRFFKKLALFLALAVSVLIVAAFALSAYARLTVSRQTAALVCPILNSSFTLDDNMVAPEAKLSELYKDNSASADEASVILLDYYMGEHNGEELVCNLTQRGSRVMPYLLKYRNHSALPLNPWFWIGRSHDKARYDEVIGYIRAGKVLTD